SVTFPPICHGWLWFRREVVSNKCSKISRSFEIGERPVASRFGFLSRFGMKFVEVGGAGVASALCAYFLGHINQPSAPPPPPPIVQVMPASEDALRMARDEHALLAALVRKEADSQAKTESAPATPALAAGAKQAKASQAEPVRRSQK